MVHFVIFVTGLIIGVLSHCLVSASAYENGFHDGAEAWKESNKN